MKRELKKFGKYLTRNTFCVILGVGLLFSSCGNKSQQQTVTNGYNTSTLVSESRTLHSVYSATIRGKQDVEIYPQVAGTITQINVEEGSIVRKGATLFVIDQIPYISALNTAKANVAAAKASLSTAQLTYDSKKELFAQNVVSAFDLQTAENELALAKAQLEQVNALLANAENNLSYTTIKSPSDGVIGTLPYKVGALVSPSMQNPLTIVSDNSEMDVYFSLNENQLLVLTRQYGSMKSALDSIPAVQLQLSDGSVYQQPGSVRSISGLIDRTTGSVTVKASFPNEGRLLHSGATGNILMPVHYENCIVIPQSATYELQDKRFVYKVVDGKAVATQITVSAINNGSEFIVTHGLSVSEVIVMAGISTLRDGMQIL